MLTLEAACDNFEVKFRIYHELQNASINFANTNVAWTLHWKNYKNEKKMALKAKYVTLILCQAIGPEINKSKIPENTLNMSRPITTG